MDKAFFLFLCEAQAQAFDRIHANPDSAERRKHWLEYKQSLAQSTLSPSEIEEFLLLDSMVAEQNLRAGILTGLRLGLGLQSNFLQGSPDFYNEFCEDSLSVTE